MNLQVKNIVNLILCQLLWSFIVLGQEYQPNPQALQKHDFSWIKTADDFDQSKLSIAQIDVEIQYLINKSIYSNRLTKEIEIPINTKKIEYLGLKHPNDLGIFSAYPVSAQNSSSINQQLHIYKYDNFYFSTEDDNVQSQKNVYFAIRAIEILKVRYPKAFQNLFTQTQKYTSDRPKFEKFANSNKAFWIAFNESPAYIAKSYTSFLRDGNFPDIDGIANIARYKNIVVMDIHAKNILGNEPTKGSKPIYKRNNSEENYYLYMKEGLLETFVHEMLHRYIDYLYPDDKTIAAIRKSRDLPNFNAAEENAIMNTSLSYFLREGGISDEIYQYYYSEVFQFNINDLKQKNQYNAYAKIFADSATISTGNDRQIFKLGVLD